MRRFSGLLLVVLLLILLTPVSAQTGEYVPYQWEAGDLALAYPAEWDAPVPGEAEGNPTLLLAQALAGTPETRPPGIPFVSLALVPGDDAGLLLPAALETLGITAGELQSNVLLGFDAVAAQGVSADGTLVGLGRAAALGDGNVLVLVGRALAANQSYFFSVFNTIADSLVSGAASEPVLPSYGPVWQALQTLSDGETAFVDLTDVAAGANNRVYSADLTVGLIELDVTSGAVLATSHPDAMVLPASLTVDGAGTVYVGNVGCGCVLAMTADGTWEKFAGDFAADAPASLAVSPDGTLYATDQPETGIQVRAITSAGEQQVAFDETVLSQPELAVDQAGRLLALTADGRLLALDGETFTLLHELNLPGAIINGFAVTRYGDYLVATENQGVLVVDADGEVSGQLGRVVPNSPLPGEFVAPRGVAVDESGMIYVADSDGTFGAVTAMSSRVETGRVGATALLPGTAVRGTLNAQTAQQEWTLDGRAGQWVTISAVDDNGGLLDVALRLIGPDGQEAAFNDDQAGVDLPNATDAQIADYRLAQDGVYTVRVEQVNGSGSYSLGISREQAFDLNADDVTRLSGALQPVLPVERWTFTGQAGQVFTFTMQASGGTLDSVLRLLDADGNVLAENDDAADTALGKDAQLVQVTLPADGTYTLEARRFDGEGGYTLVIVATS